MMLVLKNNKGKAADRARYSDAHKDAIQWRADGIGVVPMPVISRLSPDEWAEVRVMSQAEAWRLSGLLHLGPLGSRTKTPVIDDDVLSGLLRSLDA